MSTQRDELAMELFIVDNHKQSREQSIADWHLCIVSPRFAVGIKHYRAMAEGAIAAGYRKPRTLTTAEELNALPMGSKVVSAGYEWTKNYATTNTPSGGIEREVWFNVYDDFDASEDIYLPATVLYEPTA